MASSISKQIRNDGSVPLRTTPLPRTKPLDWARAAGKADVVVRGIEAEVRRNRRTRLRLAGAALVVILVATGVWQLRRTPSASIPAASSAIVSIPERLLLPDGTVIELKDGANVAVQFSAVSRRVELQTGEAHFQVARDATRPFTVQAGGVEVRAVGTAFSVQRNSNQVEVLVTEGRVEVDQRPTVDSSAVGQPPADAALQTIATLKAGNRVVVALAPDAAAATPAIVAVTPAEQADRLAWRVPRLEFVATPLADVVPVFNEHGKVRLVLADPELGRLQLSGVLRANNVDVLLRLLESSYGLKVERRGDEIVLRR